MKLKQITLDKTGQQRVQVLTERLYKACAGELLPVVLIALANVKLTVQGCSKVVTPEECNELIKKWSEDGQACQTNDQ